MPSQAVLPAIKAIEEQCYSLLSTDQGTQEGSRERRNRTQGQVAEDKG